MRQQTNKTKRLTMLAIMAVLGANLASCHDDATGFGKRPAPELKVAVAVDGKASEDGSITSDVGLSLNRDPGSDVYYVVENHTPEVCNIEPSHIDISREDWESPQSIIVSGIENDLVTGDQDCRFTVTLYDKDGNVLTSEPGVVVVEDNDSPGLHIVGSSKFTSEDGDTVTLDVSLHTQPEATVTVIITSSDITEGMLLDADGNPVELLVLIFTPENWNIPQTIQVKGIDDDIADGDQAYYIVFHLASEDPNFDGQEARHQLVNIDNDSPNIVVKIVSEEGSTTEKGGEVELSYRLQTQPDGVVTVTITSSDVGEGRLVDADGNEVDEITLVFTPDNWSEPQIVTVVGVPDGVVDGDKTYTIEARVSSDDPNYDGMSKGFELVNKDIDEPGIWVEGGITSIVVSESGTEAHLPIVLTAAPAGPVTVTVVSSNPGEASVSVTELTFTPLNWDVPQIVTVVGVPDNIDDGDQAFEITLTASDSAGAYDSAKPYVIDGLNENIDVAGVVITKESSIIIVSEADLTASVEVTLSSKPMASVTITLTVDDVNVAATDVITLTFTPENWNVPQTFVVSGIDNDVVDGNRPFIIDLVSVSADSKYHEAFIAPVHGICLDDDGAANVHVNPWEVFIDPDSLKATFTVVLTKNPGEDIIFPLSVEAVGVAAGFEVNKAVVHFSQADWYKPQVVSVSIADADAVPDAVGNFFIDIGKDASATGMYQGIDPHDVIVRYDFRPACLDPIYLGPGTYKLEAWGAQGGVTYHTTSNLNRGGYASGVLTLAEETKVWQCPGGKGGDGTRVDRIVQGGRNGGGNSGYAKTMGDDNSGGGGGSDVRIGMNTPYHRVIVAGGAGGNGCTNDIGGVGGGIDGLDGTGTNHGPNGLGGTQTEGGASVGKADQPDSFSTPGSFGYGGAASQFIANYGGAGGGGGWYGGGGGNNATGGGAGGGGGSGYVLTATSHKPAGYALGSQYHLTDTVLLHGQEVMPAPDGGTQTGQLGDGVVRISKCDSSGDNCVVCSGGICLE